VAGGTGWVLIDVSGVGALALEGDFSVRAFAGGDGTSGLDWILTTGAMPAQEGHLAFLPINSALTGFLNPHAGQTNAACISFLPPFGSSLLSLISG
jgi:hypothetical protein